MLWSLIKIVVFVAVIAAITWGASFLLESSGGLQVTVMGTEYSFGPLQSVIAVVLLIVAVWIMLKIFALLVAVWHFLNGDETALSRYFDRNRERKGYEASSGINEWRWAIIWLPSLTTSMVKLSSAASSTGRRFSSALRERTARV